jgi:hypothetical protein
MNNAVRWLFGLAAGSLIGIGCAEQVTRPPAPGSGVVLETDMGPVDLIAFDEDAEGFRHVGVHVVLENGRHVVREISVRGRTVDGMDEFTAEIAAAGVTTYRSMRRIDPDVPNRVAARVESGSEGLDVVTEPVPGGIHLVVERRGAGLAPRRVDRFLASDRLRDPAYAVAVRAELAALYPSGPLLDHPDRRLLEAVLGSPDWDVLLERGDDGAGATGSGAGSIAPTAGGDRRIRQVCAVASAVSLISCRIAPFLPPAWFACVPATGIAIACLTYNLVEAFGNDLEGACPCPCVCNDNILPEPPPPPPPIPPTEP